MKEMLTGTRTMNIDENTILNLEYYITESFLGYGEDKPYMYGVKVIKKSSERIEEAIIQNITKQYDEICCLTNQLVGGSVTPYVLGEILDEIMS